MLELRCGDARDLMARIDARTALLMSLPPLLWAGNSVIGRMLVGSVPPLTLNGLRWLIAGLLLLPLGWRAFRHPRDIARRWPTLLLLGLLGVGTYNALQYLALVTSTPINVTLVASSTPVWILLIGALFYGERPGGRQLSGAVLSIAGVLVVLVRGDVSALAGLRFFIGDFYVLIAVVAWSFYGWMLARPSTLFRAPDAPGWNWAEFLLLQIVFGLIGAGGASLIELSGPHEAVHWTGWVLLALAYIGIFPSIIAYRLWGIAIARGGPALASFFANLTPLFAAMLSAALLGEAPHVFHAVAFVLIIGGILVSSKRQ